jgi:glycosyltransferase involved in cell wall biosynthesis
MKRLSYLLATRDRAAYLGPVLDNVAQLLGPDDEFIVIDGGSRDGTRELLEQSRGVVSDFVSEPDRGEAHALNKGILRARGRWIKLLTDDDHTFPEGARAAAAVLEAHPEIDALQCGGEHWVKDEHGGERLAYHAWHPPGRPWNGDLANIYAARAACGLGLVFAARLVPRVGLLDTSYRATDTEYIMRIMAARVDYRFLAVKLYRHTGYPHSVNADPARTARDRVRLLLNQMVWDADGGDDFPLRRLAAAAGLSDEELERLLVFLARAARRPGDVAVGRALSGVGRKIWRFWEAIRPLFPGSFLPPRAQPEPIWDGSLR